MRYFQALLLLLVLLHCARGTGACRVVSLAWLSKLVTFLPFCWAITSPFIYFLGFFGAV